MSEPTMPPIPPPPPSYTPPPPPAGAGPGTVSPNRPLMIVLSYLWILFLVPLLAEKDDREVQWHAKHGAVLFVAELILLAAAWVIGMVMPDLGCTGCILNTGVIVAMLVVSIMAIMKGLNGDRLIIPGISQYADRF